MKRALVLSGGGAKGAYEIGAYKALRKMGYKFDIITGTSIGALNGAVLVSESYFMAKRMWDTITTSDLFDIGKNVTEKGMLKILVKQFFEHGGLSFNKAEAYIRRHLKESKIRKSKIDFGIVTYSVSSRSPRMLRKEDIPNGKLIDYVIASATCFPAVAAKKIDGETFIDGGFYDNLPITLAIKMGATDIIAVDLSVLAFEKKVKDTDVNIDIIKCPDKTLFTIDFTKEYSKLFMRMGYNDTMKYYGKLDGSLYTFRKNDLVNNYSTLEKIYINILTSILVVDNKGIIAKEIFNISKFNVLFTDIKQQRSIKYVVDEALEYLGALFDIKKDKLYNINKYNKLLLKNVYKLKDINVNNKLVGKLLVSYIYNKYMSATDTADLSKELFNIALLFKKEFLAAIYLIAISDKYNLYLKTDEFYKKVVTLLKNEK